MNCHPRALLANRKLVEVLYLLYEDVYMNVKGKTDPCPEEAKG